MIELTHSHTEKKFMLSKDSIEQFEPSDLYGTLIVLKRTSFSEDCGGDMLQHPETVSVDEYYDEVKGLIANV
jgi:hypothetical protein